MQYPVYVVWMPWSFLAQAQYQSHSTLNKAPWLYGLMKIIWNGITRPKVYIRELLKAVSWSNRILNGQPYMKIICCRIGQLAGLSIEAYRGKRKDGSFLCRSFICCLKVQKSDVVLTDLSDWLTSYVILAQIWASQFWPKITWDVSGSSIIWQWSVSITWLF